MNIFSKTLVGLLATASVVALIAFGASEKLALDPVFWQLNQPETFSARLLLVEVCLAVLFVAIPLAGCFLSVWSSSKTNPRPIYLACSILFFLVLLGMACGQSSGGARPIISNSILMPGSLTTRLLVEDLSSGIRRLIEPSALALFFSLLLSSWVCFTGAAAKSLRLSAVTFALVWVLEALFFGSGQSLVVQSSSYWPLIQAGHFAAWQFWLVALLFALNPWAAKEPKGIRPEVRTSATIAILATAISFSIAFICFESPSLRSPLVGAHYYVWFPENWSHGFAGEKYRPAITPALGKYKSRDVENFRHHVGWALNAGINYFIYDWWPRRPELQGRVHVMIDESEKYPDFKFSLHYEALDLKEAWDPVQPGESRNIIYLTEKRAERLRLNLESMAKRFMKRPSYLRINGRAVVFVYATRHLVGPVAKVFREAREHVKQRTGVDLYIVADEAYFHVLKHTNRKGIFLLPEYQPNWNRASAFDAITSYNPYDSSRTAHAGSAGVENFIADTREMYRVYQAMTAVLGQAFIPGIIPGYNDRGVRPWVRHHVIPREYGENKIRSLFATSLQELALPFVDEHAPMIAITSWNEWNESTQIEPTIAAEQTNEDESGDVFTYSQSEYYSGYACRHLDELTDALSEQNSQ